MPTKWTKRIVGIIVLGLVVAGLAWFAWPRPLPVDLVTVNKGPIEVTADDDGKTHVRHIYTVSASGRRKGFANFASDGRAGAFASRRRSGHGE